MKNKNVVLTLIFAVLFSITLNSCNTCKNEDPRARIKNNGTKVATVQIKTSNGNTENINGVEAGATSEYKTYASGEVTFTITVDNKPYEKTFLMGECFEYDIAIDANNVITTTPIDRND